MVSTTDEGLSHGLVAGAAVVCGTVGEEVVDDHADDGEEENDKAPDELRDGRAVRLEHLDWNQERSAVNTTWCYPIELTEDNNIQNQDD